jgi:hypothetical protein
LATKRNGLPASTNLFCRSPPCSRPRSARAPAVSLHAGSDFVRIAISRQSTGQFPLRACRLDGGAQCSDSTDDVAEPDRTINLALERFAVPGRLVATAPIPHVTITPEAKSSISCCPWFALPTVVPCDAGPSRPTPPILPGLRGFEIRTYLRQVRRRCFRNSIIRWRLSSTHLIEPTGVDGAIKGPFAKPKCEVLIHLMHDFVTRFVARQDESIVDLTRSSVGQGGGIGLMCPSARLSGRELFSRTLKAEGNFVVSRRIDERCRPAGLLPRFQRGS